MTLRAVRFGGAGRAAMALATVSLLGCTRVRACTSPRPEPVVALAKDGGVAGTLAASGPCVHAGPGQDYPVGPGQKYAKIGDVPWERLGAGDTVRIHARPEPYKEKIMVGGIGRVDAPIRVCGVPGPDGALPVLDGDGATTRPSRPR